MRLTNAVLPIETNNSLGGDWMGASDWVLPDTCPKCHNLNCNQLLDGDRVSRYLCPNPECNHEWIPTEVMEIKEAVHCIKPEVEIDLEDAETIEAIERVQEGITKQFLFGQR